MSEPITPKFMADTVVLDILSIQYKPVWNAGVWTIDPNDIRLQGVGTLSEAASGVDVLQADITFPASDLPASGLTALQELLGFVEDAMAVKYS